MGRRRSLHSSSAATYSVRLKRQGQAWVLSTWDDWFAAFFDSEPMSYSEAIRVQAEHRRKVRAGEVEGKAW